MLLKDSNGGSIGFLDGEHVRDANGKEIASRSSSDSEEYRLSRLAAHRMMGRLSSRHIPTVEEARACSDRTERQVLMDLAPGDVLTPSARDDGLYIGDNDSGCIADIVSGVRNVTRDRGYLWTENAADLVRVVLPSASASGAPGEVNPSFTNVPFTTTTYAIAARLPRATITNADFDLKLAAAHYLIEILRLAREVRVATLLTASANWASGNQIAAPAKWNGMVIPDPLADLFSALAASYLPANTLILSEYVDRYFFQASTATSVQIYRQASGKLPARILTARARSMVGGILKYVWSPGATTNVALVRAPDDPLRIPTSTTLRWLGDERIDQGERVDGFFVRTYSDQAGGAFGADVVVVVHNDAEIMINTPTTKCQVGALITGAIA